MVMRLWYGSSSVDVVTQAAVELERNLVRRRHPHVPHVARPLPPQSHVPYLRRAGAGNVRREE